MSVVSSRDLTRPGSRSSVATTMDSRPIYLLERCLAIRFEKASASLTGGANTNRQKKAPSRPPSSLSHLSNWLPWQKNGANGGNGRKTPSSSVSERNQMIREDCEDGLEDAQGDSKSKSSVVSLMTAGKPPMSPPPSSSVAGGGRQAAPPGWVYDGGFVLFQNFQEANGYCYWNASLLEAITALQFVGHVAPATVLVTGDESSLETVRGAWARKVLRAPRSYVIVLVGDVDGCAVQPISQSQFTPLPEALCWVIWELNLAERSSSLEDVTNSLSDAFPDLVAPTHKVVYDTLGKLIRERKIYYTGKGYGVVTPDTYRKTSVVENAEKSLLLSNEEALARAHGTVETYPHGNVVDKAIQTNLVDVICRGSGTEKVIYGRMPDEIPVIRPRLQRQRSLRIFNGTLTGKRSSWSELKGAGSSGGSLKLSPAKAKKLLDECTNMTDWEGYADESADDSAKAQKDKPSLLSRIFRRSQSKKRTNLVSFSAQFPPPEWTERGKTIHLHSVAVQTQFNDCTTPGSLLEKRGVASSGRSECSTSLSFSSPTPSRRSFQRRTTLPSGHFSARSESCSPFRMPTNSGKLSSNDDRSLHHHQQHHHHHQSNIRSSGSPATSISSGLGRSFSPASAHSYQRPPCHPSLPSPTQSTDSLYSSSVGPSASVIQSPVPSFDSKSVVSDRTFNRANPARASYGGRHYASSSATAAAAPAATTSTSPLDYQPFPRMTARSLSYRQPKSTTSVPLSSTSTPRPYVSDRERLSTLTQQRASLRTNFFRTELVSPPLLTSIMNERKLSIPKVDTLSDALSSASSQYTPRGPQLDKGKPFVLSSTKPAEKSLVQAASTGKACYETDLDLTIKVPKNQEKTIHSNLGDTSSSRVINISVTNSESVNFVSLQNEANAVSDPNKENTADDLKNHTGDKALYRHKTTDETFRTFPSLTELNINFKSITGQKILQGLNSNSTDTLVECELAMRDGEMKADLGYI